MPDSSSDQESQNVGYDSDPDSPAFPHFASTRIQTVGSALASALNSLEDRGAAPASREATLASQERQDIPRIAETCSAPGAGGDPAESVRGQPEHTAFDPSESFTALTERSSARADC